jgi:hypothetical protein
MALICEHHNDGVEKPQERERGEERKETRHQKFFACEIPYRVAGYDACYERDA